MQQVCDVQACADTERRGKTMQGETGRREKQARPVRRGVLEYLRQEIRDFWPQMATRTVADGAGCSVPMQSGISGSWSHQETLAPQSTRMQTESLGELH